MLLAHARSCSNEQPANTIRKETPSETFFQRGRSKKQSSLRTCFIVYLFKVKYSRLFKSKVKISKTDTY